MEGLEEFAGVPKDLGLGSSGISHLGWMRFCGYGNLSLKEGRVGCLHSGDDSVEGGSSMRPPRVADPDLACGFQGLAGSVTVS